MSDLIVLNAKVKSSLKKWVTFELLNRMAVIFQEGDCVIVQNDVVWCPAFSL